ncbi:tetratricopeptide repeat protein [Nonomuraea sp. NPDC048826]|uniref:tetratricopeptide repeat protein n=1 Tax=Nonomuraea sp. NPDC048826 TaxID=3364347 RepID=UPI003710AFDD
MELVATIAGVIAALLAVPAAMIALPPVVAMWRDRRRRRASLVRGDSGSGASTGADAPDVAGGIGSVEAPVGRLPALVRGREDLMRRLRQALEVPGGPVQVLGGMGGLGKTTIALKLAEEFREEQRVVWWVEATSRGQVETLLLQVAQDDLGVPPENVQDALAGRRNAADVFWGAVRRTGKAGGFALILDNADDPHAVLAPPGGVAGDGNGWIRTSPMCATVVTSRDRDPKTWGPLCEVNAIEPIDEEAAAQMLCDLAPGVSDTEQAVVLARRLQCLPLALYLAGTLIAWPHSGFRTFAAYRQALERDMVGILDMRPDTSQPPSDRQVVARTWQLSLHTLRNQQVKEASTIALVLAQLADAHTVPSGMLNPVRLGALIGATSNQVAVAIEALARVGLTDPASDGDIPGYRLHPLVAETLRVARSFPRFRILPVRHDLQQRAWAIGLHLLHTEVGGLDPAQPRDWPMGVLLAQHLRALIGRGPGRPPRDLLRELASSASTVIDILSEYGSYPSASQLGDEAVRWTRPLSARDPALLQLRHSLAILTHRRGRFPQAEDELRKVLADRLRVLGPDDPDTLLTRHDLAVNLHRQGNLREAEKYYREVLDDRRRVLGPDHPDTLLTGHHLGRALQSREEFRKAAESYRDILDNQRRVLGPDHPQTLHTEHTLATVLIDLGMHQEAETALRRVLADRERVLGEDHPDTLLTRYDLATTLHKSGRFEEAKSAYERVLADRERMLGPDHPDTSLTRHSLALVLIDFKEFSEDPL